MIPEEVFVEFLFLDRVSWSPFLSFWDEILVRDAPLVGFEEPFVEEESPDRFFSEAVEGDEEPYLGDESSIVLVFDPDRFQSSSIGGFIDP